VVFELKQKSERTIYWLFQLISLITTTIMLLFLTCVAPFISPELEFTRQQIMRDFGFIAHNPQLPKPEDELQPEEPVSGDEEIIKDVEQPVIHEPEPIPEAPWQKTPVLRDRPEDFDDQFERENPILTRRSSPTLTPDDPRRVPTRPSTITDHPTDRQTTQIQRKTFEPPPSDSERRNVYRELTATESPFARETPTINSKVNIPDPPKEIEKRKEVPTPAAAPDRRLEVEWSVEITNPSSTEAYDAFAKFPRIYRKLQLRTANGKEHNIPFNSGDIILKPDFIVIIFHNKIMHELDFRVDNKGRYYISLLKGSTLKKTQIDFMRDMIRCINLLESSF